MPTQLLQDIDCSIEDLLVLLGRIKISDCRNNDLSKKARQVAIPPPQEELFCSKWSIILENKIRVSLLRIGMKITASSSRRRHLEAQAKITGAQPGW